MASQPNPGAAITTHSTLTSEEVGEVRELTKLVTEADGLSPLSEHVLLHLRHGGDVRAWHLLARDIDGHLVGYLHLDQTDEVAGPAIEVSVIPAERGHGIGSALVRNALAQVGAKGVRLWAHGQLAGAHKLAQSLGFLQVRELWQMRRSLFAPVPKAQEISGVTIRSFNPGIDDLDWVKLNSEIFSLHPEQGGWTERDLHIRMSEPWFDPDGFFVAVDETEQMIGFAWTKIHGSSNHGNHEHSSIGELYVVGVDEEFRGQGISTLLSIKALEYLRGHGLPAVMLYVDADNTLAIEVYKSIGFTHWDTDVMFRKPSA